MCLFCNFTARNLNDKRMLKRLPYYLLLFGLLLLPSLLAAQETETAQPTSTDTIPSTASLDTTVREGGKLINGVWLNEKQLQRYYKKQRKDSIRAKKPVWWSILGGPSYTPEASLGVGGAVVASFRIKKNDSLSQRSFIPAGFNISLNGTFVVAGAGTLFFNQNKFRIYIKYGFRHEPSH